jgi:hypothetical protein
VERLRRDRDRTAAARDSDGERPGHGADRRFPDHPENHWQT